MVTAILQTVCFMADLCDIMISGDGLIDGSSWNEEKVPQYVLRR
ncbi:MAG: hypothetical protein ACLRZ6_06395 [Lachnospiraceae bacterium]